MVARQKKVRIHSQMVTPQMKKCTTANIKSFVISMCVIPVLVQYKLCNCAVETYGILDKRCQATFIRNKLLGALVLHGRKKSITVKTRNDKVTMSS